MSNVPQFAEGELVNITVRGARVVQIDSPESDPLLSVNAGIYSFEVPAIAPGVTVERVAPAEWPPRKGDRWENEDGAEWCAIGRPMSDEIDLISIADGIAEAFEDVLADSGPLRLKSRAGWSPATDATPAAPTPEQVDKRAAMVAGFRALADLLEAHPEIPMGASLGGQTYYLGLGDDAKIRSAIERDAATLGVTLRERQHSTDPACIVISGDYPVGGGVALALHASVATAAPLPHRNPDDARMSLDEALADADAQGLLAETLDSEVAS